jgi:hypothetical protein
MVSAEEMKHNAYIVLQPLYVRCTERQCFGHEDYGGRVDGLYKYGSGICLDSNHVVHWRFYWVSAIVDYLNGHD